LIPIDDDGAFADVIGFQKFRAPDRGNRTNLLTA
jgi:hypothetical protein